MPYTDFHYTPTGTGVISGKEVLEQTENAINDLGGQISGDVQTAIDTANNALNVASTASTDAQNAVNTANTAYTAATNAQNTANAAQNTANNALTAAQSAQNDVNALGNRVTTAENNITQNTTDISGLTTRMGTAEGNITTLQNDVVTAQGTATSAQNTATLARGQAYVVRYASVAVSDNSSVPYTDLNNVDNIKANDLLLDTNGKLYQITSVDTVNETVSVTTPLTQLAVDANVMHLSGNETVAGVKTFSDDTFIKSLNFTNEVPSQSSSSSSIMPIVTTITYGDSSPSVQARVNLEVTADGTKYFYPHENNQYSCGLTSRRWSTIFGYFANLGGVYLGNEASLNHRTNLYLIANRDTDGQSGCYVTRYRRNKAQGALAFSDQPQIGIDFLENSVRTTNIFNIVATDWTNDVPGRILINSVIANYSFGSVTRKCLINELNPGSLSLPDLNNGIDISGYITLNSDSSYTPISDGYVYICCYSSAACGLWVRDANNNGISTRSIGSVPTYNNLVSTCIPVVKNVALSIFTPGCENILTAKFYPCLGNV